MRDSDWSHHKQHLSFAVILIPTKANYGPTNAAQYDTSRINCVDVVKTKYLNK